MCGEQEAQGIIANPNDFDDYESGDKRVWDVCTDCKTFIKAGQQLAFGMAVKEATGDDSILHDAEKKLNLLSQVSDKPMLNVILTKKQENQEDVA
jgi:hypothetical protein